MLRSINILGNNLGMEAAKAIVTEYGRTTTLISLCGLNEELTEVNLSKKRLGTADCMLLAGELNHGVGVTSLASLVLDNIMGAPVSTSLPWAPARMEGANEVEAVCNLVQGLATGTSLTRLSLKGNGLGPECAIALAKLVADGCLKILNLDKNALAGRTHGCDAERTEGVRALAVALNTTTTIHSLSLMFNYLGPECVTVIAHTVGCGSLRTLSILHNAMGKEGAKALVETYNRLTSLESLGGFTSETQILSSKDLQAADAMLIAAELKKAATTGSLNILQLSGRPGMYSFPMENSGLLQ
jgi:hypothetical protein